MSSLPSQNLTQQSGPLTHLVSDLGWVRQKYDCMVQVLSGLRQFLAEVAMLLSASFLENLASILSTRPLVYFLALVRRLLVGLCVGSFLGTYTLNSLERQEKQTYVHRSHTFFMKVQSVDPAKFVGTSNNCDLLEQPLQKVHSWESYWA